MELLQRTSEAVIPKKRSFEELLKHRKIVPAVRDFPPGCGITEAERKPLKILTKAHSDIGNITSDGDDKLVDSNRVESNTFNSSKPKEFGGNKPSVVSRPAGKVKFWDPTCTKAGYDQKPKVTTTYGTQRKDFNNVDSNVRKITPAGMDKLVNSGPVDSNIRKMTPYVVDKLVNSRPVDSNIRKMTPNCKDKLNCGSVENSKLTSFEPKELGRSKSYLGSRSTSKVKFWDPNCKAQKSEDTTHIVSHKEEIQRAKIKEAMSVFYQVYEPFNQENRLKPKTEKIPSWRVPMEVAKIVKQKLKWMDPGKILGPVCGVQIGDKFNNRALLMMFGLHNQPQSGIDYANIKGKNLAISVVDAQRYSNESGYTDTLVYSGQGGVGLFGSKLPPEDQKLERGNLALKNSMDKKSPVRVIRKVQGYGKDVFAYDGLYTVNHYTDEKSAEGKIVFKFHLIRVPGQPSLHEMLKW